MAAKIKFKPRQLTEMAIEVMKKSINEPRADKKASPLVGAVLLMRDGGHGISRGTPAWRSCGIHFAGAQASWRTAGWLGFVCNLGTVCAGGTEASQARLCRADRERPDCRSVGGIEDRDPTVDRQGIKVRLFDLDLQEQIRWANKEFIAQAFKRAAEAKDRKAAKPSPLSTWDEVLAGVKLADLASDALARYREQTKISDKTVSAGFIQRLEHQGLLRRRGSKLVPTGFGFLLFGKRPRDVLHHAGLSATIEFPDGTHEIQNFDGPAILIPDFVEDWLRPKLPNVIDRSRMTREERPALPFDLVREAVINALVHRDYDLTGATCHLVVTVDTVTVRARALRCFPSPWSRCRRLPRLCIIGIQNFSLLSAERSYWKDADWG
jgi:ATP-dependent DNA helicase RecG